MSAAAPLTFFYKDHDRFRTTDRERRPWAYI